MSVNSFSNCSIASTNSALRFSHLTCAVRWNPRVQRQRGKAGLPMGQLGLDLAFPTVQSRHLGLTTGRLVSGISSVPYSLSKSIAKCCIM